MCAREREASQVIEVHVSFPSQLLCPSGVGCLSLSLPLLGCYHDSVRMFASSLVLVLVVLSYEKVMMRERWNGQSLSLRH